jgi:hypothetical protein
MNGAPLFEIWCDITEHRIGQHRLRVMTEKAGTRASIESILDAAVLDNYDDLGRLRHWANVLGLPNAAAVLDDTFPTDLRAKSGHMGEICLTESIPELFPEFIVPIKRLRWLDGRNMFLRGEDFIGVRVNVNPVRFLKAEAKSRKRLAAGVIGEARAALNRNNGRPSPHAMLFIARRLDELNQQELSLIFLEHERRIGITDAQLVHVVFTFSGNDSTELLKNDLQVCGNAMEQHAVGLVIPDHSDFIQAIYARLTDAVNN